MEIKLTDLPQPMASLLQVGLKHLGLYDGTTRGIPGEKTQAAYSAFLASWTPPPMPVVDLSSVPAALRVLSQTEMRDLHIRLALAEVGVREEGGNNRGRRVQQYQDGASDLDGTGWAWCAAFQCFLFDLLGEQCQLPFAKPETAAAFRFEAWARAVRLPVRSKDTKIKRGDLIIYAYSHIGLASTDEDSEGKFHCVEGNTSAGDNRDGDVVANKPKTHATAQIRSIIRPFPLA